MNFSARRVIGFTVFSAVITMTIGTASHEGVWQTTFDSVQKLKSTKVAKGDDLSYIIGDPWLWEAGRKWDFEGECLDMAVIEHIDHPGRLMAKKKQDEAKRIRKIEYFKQEKRDLENESDSEETGDEEEERKAMIEQFGNAIQELKPRYVTPTLQQYKRIMEEKSGDSFDDDFCGWETENKLKMLSIIIQLLEATIDLHQAGIAHNKIDEDHIVYNEQSGEMMLMDFGKSVFLHTLSLGDLREALHRDIRAIDSVRRSIVGCYQNVQLKDLYEKLEMIGKVDVENKKDTFSINTYFKNVKSLLGCIKTTFEEALALHVPIRV